MYVHTVYASLGTPLICMLQNVTCRSLLISAKFCFVSTEDYVVTVRLLQSSNLSSHNLWADIDCNRCPQPWLQPTESTHSKQSEQCLPTVIWVCITGHLRPSANTIHKYKVWMPLFSYVTSLEWVAERMLHSIHCPSECDTACGGQLLNLLYVLQSMNPIGYTSCDQLATCDIPYGWKFWRESLLAIKYHATK